MIRKKNKSSFFDDRQIIKSLDDLWDNSDLEEIAHIIQDTFNKYTFQKNNIIEFTLPFFKKNTTLKLSSDNQDIQGISIEDMSAAASNRYSDSTTSKTILVYKNEELIGEIYLSIDENGEFSLETENLSRFDVSIEQQ